MKTILSTIIGTTALLIPYHATAEEVFLGPYLTEDNSSVVSLERCADNPMEVCGYLIGFELTGKKQTDRAMCRFRLLGGLTPHGKKLHGGWIMDIDSGETYKLSIRKGHEASTINLVIYDTIEALNTTIIWKRYDENLVEETPPLCVTTGVKEQVQQETP